jgi:pimeloyl-ACP methyl ester carboxylesterase
MHTHLKQNAPILRSHLSALCALLVCVAPPISAQRQPVVLAHGIRSDSSTWSVDSPLLQQHFPVQIRAATSTWTESQRYQAATLAGTAFLGLPDSTVAIGHSNGGIVLRQAGMNDSPMRSLLTIGTLNFGAPAAHNVMNSTMAGIALPVFDDIFWFTTLFVTNSLDFEDLVVYGAMSYSAQTIATSVMNIFLAKVGFNSYNEGWASMYPSSPYIVAINSPDSIAKLAQNVPVRAYVRTSIGNPYDALFRLVYSEDSAAATAAQLAFVSFMLQEDGYQLQYKYCSPYQSYDLNKCAASAFVIFAASDLMAIPDRYCRRMMYEGVGLYDTSTGYCGTSDGVVPYERQPLPSAQFEYVVDQVSHTEQTKSPLVLDRMERFVEDRAFVKRCGTGPVTSVIIRLPSNGVPYVGQTRLFPVDRMDSCPALTSAGAAFTASSSNQNVAGISISGPNLYVTGIAAGTATITVTSGGISATKTLVIRAFPYL